MTKEDKKDEKTTQQADSTVSTSENGSVDGSVDTADRSQDIDTSQEEEQCFKEKKSKEQAASSDEHEKDVQVIKSASGFPDVRPGMWVRVHQRIKELNAKGEEKERIQVFEGRVIARKGGTEQGATITVHKESFGVGVEKIFPVHMPSIERIEIVKKARVRRSKLWYLLRGYKKRLKEEKMSV